MNGFSVPLSILAVFLATFNCYSADSADIEDPSLPLSALSLLGIKSIDISREIIKIQPSGKCLLMYYKLNRTEDAQDQKRKEKNEDNMYEGVPVTEPLEDGDTITLPIGAEMSISNRDSSFIISIPVRQPRQKDGLLCVHFSNKTDTSSIGPSGSIKTETWVRYFQFNFSKTTTLIPKLERKVAR